MKWEVDQYRLSSMFVTDAHVARCGHLRVHAVSYSEYGTPGHRWHDPSHCEWYVALDDGYQSYRRALARGTTSTIDAAKQDAADACRRIVEGMLASLAEGA